MEFFRVIYFLITCLPLAGFSQVSGYHSGARSLGMAHSDQTCTDGWSAFNNIAGISALKNTTAFFSYTNRYGLAGLNSMAAGVVVPAGNVGNFTLNVYRFGDRVYNEQKLGFGYANKVGFVRLGVQLHYLQLNVEGLGRTDTWIIGFGGIIELIKRLVFAAHIFNLNAAGPDDGWYVPVIMQAGMSYRPVKGLMINGGMIYEVEGAARWSGGLEYGLYEKLFLRAGVRSSPATHFFGLGFYPGRFRFDYAFSRDFKLGFVHEASVLILFGSIK
jgi:hypothetical protein